MVFLIEDGLAIDRGRGHIQMGSLAGAAHLLNNNAGALRLTQRERKSLVD